MDLTGLVPGSSVGQVRGHRRLDLLLTLLVVGVAATWALLTPPLRAPDEPQHLNSVLRLAYGGGWPQPGDAVMAPAVQQARIDVALETDVPGRFTDRIAVPQFADAVIVPAAERARVDAATALPRGPATRPEDVDQMSQHPPLYYALGAAVLHATGLVDARWDQQVLALRLLDVALLAPLVPLAAWSARRLTGSVAAGAVAATFPLLVPQMQHILGAVNNDALVTLVGAVVTALVVKVLTGDRSLRTATVIGVVVGIGLLTKVMAAFLLPVVALAYLTAPGGVLGPRTVGRRRALGADVGRVLLAGGVALAVGGWWWVRNVVVYGTVQPVGMDRVPVDLVVRPATTYVVKAWRTLALSFFGDFGWLDLRTPQAFWLTATLVLLALGVVALTSRRTWRAALVLIALPTILTGAIIANAWGYYHQHGMMVGLQGRYLSGALAALAVVVAVAVLRLVGGLEARMRVAVPVVLLGGLAITAYGLWFAFEGFFRPAGWTVARAWERWEVLSPVGPAALATVGAATSVVGAVTLAAAVAQAARRPRAPVTQGDAAALCETVRR
ncbi:DUF2142 domain-containing protein [Xylanimonas allomyrinae]|uniref:DUF2142 domain-containing protein n=1 Tax=Xylanimonas allomyrinae TaxID=2509459 RepID=A0A4P6EM54_9MICO|nr:DUF2142 domain-containing protein [Xylanimonas allomyrinae]QAY63366.1 DUF2142 domain-containing protein [Xylanimonas allomyrinae]